MTIYKNHDEALAYNGMSLRDYFAGQALAGLCANPGGPFQANDSNGWNFVNTGPNGVAAVCAALADAMIEARESVFLLERNEGSAS